MYVRTILIDSLHFYFGNFSQIVLLCLPILCIAVLSQYLIFIIPEFDAAPLVSAVLGLLFYPIYTAALILFIAKRTSHEYPSKISLLAASLKIWAPLVLLTLLVGILIAFGLILLIIPGIWVAIRLSLSEVFLVVGGLKPIDAISASFAATKEYFWIIFICIFLVMLPIYGMSYGLGYVSENLTESYLFSFAMELFIAIFTLFVNVVIFRIFMLAGMEQENI